MCSCLVDETGCVRCQITWAPGDRAETAEQTVEDEGHAAASSEILEAASQSSKTLEAASQDHETEIETEEFVMPSEAELEALLAEEARLAALQVSAMLMGLMGRE